MRLSGLRDFNRLLRNMEKGVRKEVREKFKGVGRIVVKQAQKNARDVFDGGTKYHTGDLARKITPRSSARGIMVVASAKDKKTGYHYARRLEFDQKIARRRLGVTTKGRFFYPAVEQKRKETLKEMEKVLDWLEREWMK